MLNVFTCLSSHLSPLTSVNEGYISSAFNVFTIHSYQDIGLDSFLFRTEFLIVPPKFG